MHRWRKVDTLRVQAGKLTVHRLLCSRGWAQITEWELVFRSDSGDSDALQALHEWSRLYTESLRLTNRPEGKKSSSVAQDVETWMRMAGFVNVSVDVRDVPTCAWHTGMFSQRLSFG